MSGIKITSGTSASAEPETLGAPDTSKSTEASRSPETPEVPEAPDISPEAPDTSLGIASGMRGSSSSC